MVTRLCTSQGMPAAPSIEKCRTVISNNFQSIRDSLLQVSKRPSKHTHVYVRIHRAQQTMFHCSWTNFLPMQKNITASTVGMTMSNLTGIVNATSETSDQNSDNLAVVDTILSGTAALLQGPGVDLPIDDVTEVRVCK